MSLRDELLGAPVLPDFAVVLPTGWSEFAANADSEKRLLDAANRRLREAHRPDLAAQLRALTGRAFGGMRASDTVRFYVQTEGWTDDLVLPLSITASLRIAPDRVSFDDSVARLIRDGGATSLNDDMRFVRWESGGELTVGSTLVGQHTVSYLTPVPGTSRRTALQFTAVAVHPSGPDEGWRPLVDAMAELSDAIVSTLAWRIP